MFVLKSTYSKDIRVREFLHEQYVVATDARIRSLEDLVGELQGKNALLEKLVFPTGAQPSNSHDEPYKEDAQPPLVSEFVLTQEQVDEALREENELNMLLSGEYDQGVIQ